MTEEDLTVLRGGMLQARAVSRRPNKDTIIDTKRIHDGVLVVFSVWRPGTLPPL